MSVSKTAGHWVHEHLAASYLQGVALMDYAFNDVIYTAQERVKTLKERVVSWIQGFFLVIPIVSNIIWIAWKTFGNPKILFDPYDPEVKKKFTPKAAPVTTSPTPTEEGGLFKPKEKSFAIHIQKEDLTKEGNLKVTEKEKEIAIEHREKNAQVTMLFDKVSKKTTELQADFYGDKFTVLSIDENTLSAAFGNGPRVTLNIPEHLPWIQYPMVGFQDFILSDHEEFDGSIVLPPLRPYASFLPSAISWVIPNEPTLREFSAKKVSTEDGIVKVEGRIKIGWFSWHVADFFFDAKTGELKSLKSLVTDAIVTFEQNDPSPESERP